MALPKNREATSLARWWTDWVIAEASEPYGMFTSE